MTKKSHRFALGVYMPSAEMLSALTSVIPQREILLLGPTERVPGFVHVDELATQLLQSGASGGTATLSSGAAEATDAAAVAVLAKQLTFTECAHVLLRIVPGSFAGHSLSLGSVRALLAGRIQGLTIVDCGDSIRNALEGGSEDERNELGSLQERGAFLLCHNLDIPQWAFTALGLRQGQIKA